MPERRSVPLALCCASFAYAILPADGRTADGGAFEASVEGPVARGIAKVGRLAGDGRRAFRKLVWRVWE